MKKYLCSILLLAASFLVPQDKLSADVTISNPDQITYDFLAGSLWTDHVRSFKILFELEPIDSFLEFGLGWGSKFFLDNCKHVTSIELLVEERTPHIVPWYNETVELLKGYSNWSPGLHKFSDVVNEANLIALQHRNPESVSSAYLVELDEFIDGVFKDKQYDVAFVDPGIHIRGDIVNAVFGRSDIVVLHDTNFNGECYGTYKVRPPANYETIRCGYGSGITFWIVNEKKELIEKLRERLSHL